MFQLRVSKPARGTLHGGRVLKFKGDVVNAAPSTGQFVFRSASCISATVISACLLFSGTEVRAANECGAAPPGPNPVVNCDSTNNPYAGGIRYTVPGITLNLDGTAAPLNITRAGGSGVVSVGNGPQDHVVNALGTVNVSTAGFNALGVSAGNTDGSVTINYNDGDISIGPGWYGIGIFVRGDGAGDGTINYNAGTINTVGHFSYSLNAWAYGSGDAIINYTSGIINGGAGWYVGGPYARAVGSGNAIITIENADTTSTDYRGYGAIAQTDGAGDATVIVKAGTIDTSGYEAIGAHAYVGGAGALLVDVRQGTQINTSGFLANGILGTIAPVTNSSTLTLRNAGTLNTSGDFAYGIWGWHGGSGNILIENTGDVTASGSGASGIRAEAATLATYDINVLGGTITSGSGTAAGIHVIGESGGTIDIAAGARIDGSTSGIAIRDGDQNVDGTDETGGNVVVTSAGAVTGDAILGLGNDTFNLTSGTVDGNIYGDDIAASNNDGDDRFNWSGGTLTGGFYGQNGSDTAIVSGTAMFDGSEILDGGDDAGTGDGWIDVLTFAGASGIVNGGNIINWEVVQFTGPGTTHIVDFVTPAVNVCNGSVILGGASMANDVLGCVSDDDITITDNTVISSSIQGAGGADTITVSGNASVGGGIYGGNNGQDGSAAADTGDTITIDTTGSVGWVSGGAGEDQIFLKNGTVTNYISGGDGNDYIEASGGATEVIVGNDGDDFILVTGTAKVVNTKNLPDETSVDGNAGNDTIQIDGNAVVSGVDGDDGDDTLLLYGGEITTTFATGNGGSDGGAGEDLIILDGTRVHGALSGGLDNDTILIKSGSAAIVAGNSHDDHIVMTGGEVEVLLGDVGGLFANPDNGNDIIELRGGTIGTVMGDQGNDIIILAGAIVSGTIAGDTIPSIYNPAPLPGSGNDRFIWTSGTMAAFAGGDGSDTADVSASEYDGSQILDGGDVTSSADGWIDTLTLQGLTVTVNGGNILNWENVVVDGGAISFSDNMIAAGSGAGTGLTITNGAVLDGGTQLNVTGNLMLTAGGVFEATGSGSGIYSVTGSILNNGVINMQDGVAGDMVMSGGDYSGTGALLVDTNFTTGSSDTLVVKGSVTGGTTTVFVGDISSGDATGNDVLVVDVAGTSSDADFALAGGEVVTGPYSYTLNLESDTNWYLQSTVLPQVEAYAPVVAVIQSMGRDFLGNLWERVGHRETGWSAEGRGDGTGIWGRAHGKLLNAGSDVTSTGSEFETGHGFFQAGVDFAGFDLDGGDLVLSVIGHYGASETRLNDADGVRASKADITGYGVGGSATFYNRSKTFFLDAIGQATWYDAKIGAIGRRASGKTDGFGYALGAETGYRYAISGQWAFVPQAQLLYSNADYDRFTDTDGVVTTVLDGESLEGRIGLALEGHSDVSAGYFRVNLIEEFMGKNKIDASGTTFTTNVSGTSVELSAGGSFEVKHGIRLYTDITARTALDRDLTSFRGTAGVKVNW